MKKRKYFKTIILLLACVTTLTTSSLCMDKVVQASNMPVASTSVTRMDVVSPQTIVNSPERYLNRTISMNAKFDKFSTLGLDYKSAMRSSEQYISFLIKREDTKYDIPLSEMKLFIKRSDAEKHINLKTNDVIKIVGTVFSNALGDAWVDVEQIELIEKAPETNGVG